MPSPMHGPHQTISVATAEELIPRLLYLTPHLFVFALREIYPTVWRVAHITLTPVEFEVINWWQPNELDQTFAKLLLELQSHHNV